MDVCSRDLILKATRGVAIALVSSRGRRQQQPGFATDNPAFVKQFDAIAERSDLLDSLQ
ncbi:hypothetical protein [Leptolyngbya sp. NIES-2104]|uniref:hypothetical protein n=1 Tax=Leptolyngbya sp. NIES-2104 TaxID=1552121 RepID=UPI0006ECAEE8|nr:hypothetical protein [Leptolyngbya sp. NIES-2104]GAP98009.1 hypothetical protein NIES2104_45620 [Leptolyngbya sp. NIES-2104]